MTRPDYCPVAQEPCQAMCVLSDVRCKIRDAAPQPQPDHFPDAGKMVQPCSPAEYRIRCRMAESCLPEAEYKTRLTTLHDDMLAEIEALREALKRIDAMCFAPPDFSDATMQEIARAALAQGETK